MGREEGAGFSRMLDSRSDIVLGAKKLLSGTLLASQALSLSGTVAGIVITSYYGFSRGSLPTDANPGFRDHVTTEIQTAVQDLIGKPSFQGEKRGAYGSKESVVLPEQPPNSAAAWNALQPAESQLQDSLPELWKDVTSIENILFSPPYGKVFTRQIQGLKRVDARIRGLGNTPDARSFVNHTNDRDTGRTILLGSLALGAMSSVGGNYYARRGKGNERQRSKR